MEIVSQSGKALGSIVAALRGSLAAARAPAKTKAPVRITSEYCKIQADYVLAAEDINDLHDRLESVAGDNVFWERPDAPPPPQTSVVEAVNKYLATPLDLASLTRTLGIPATDRCKQGDAALRVLAGFVLRWSERLAWLAESQPPPGKKSTVADILYDDRVPISLRSEFLRFLTGIIAAVAIGRAEEHGKKLSPWLAVALADRFASAGERVVGFTKAKGVARFARTLWRDARREKKLRAAAERWNEKARSEGLDVYAPVSSPDDHLR